MSDLRERLATQWERLGHIWYIPLGELTLMDLAWLAGMFYLAFGAVRFVLSVIDDRQRRRRELRSIMDKPEE